MKHIKLFEEFLNDEQFIGEAARVGRSSWSSILSDLKKDGWDIKGNLASKYYDEEGEERRLELDNDGDDIWWTVYDGDDKEINSGSFDGEGLSAGELDGEVWSYIEESAVNGSFNNTELSLGAGGSGPLREAVDVKYWTDYHEDSSKITSMSKVANAVEDQVISWNKNNEDGKNNEIGKEDEKKVMNLAHDFFKAAGWISTDIIQAMIAQT